MDAREAALLTLNTCERQGGWSDGALKKQLAAAGLDGRDAALATQLCFGVLQNKLLLDFYLGKFSNIPLKRMEGKVVQALRLGAYQMLFLTRIPHSAAVDRSVALTRAHCKNPRAPGMVNAILRSLERSLDQLPTIPQEDPAAYYGTLYSHPAWLVEELLDELGSEGAAAFLRANNSQPPMTAMVNTVRAGAEEVAASLEAQGVEVKPHPWLENCLILSRSGSVEELEAFQKGGDAGAGCVRRPRRQVLCRRHSDGGPGRGGVLRPPSPQKDPDPPWGGAAGPVLCPGPHRRRQGTPDRVGGGIRPGAGGRALLRAGGDPEKAGHPL